MQLMHPVRMIMCGGLLSLSACKVGPNYEPPVTSIPDRYAWTDPEQTNPPAEPATWWRLFHDPVLDDLMARASVANFDLRIAAEQIVQYQAMYGVASADRFPDINAMASYSRERTPSGDLSVPGFADAGANNDWVLGLDASWEIDLFGRIARAIEASQGDLQAIIEDWRYAMVTVRAEVATTYIDIRTTQARLNALQANLGAQRRFVELLEQQYRAGTTTESAVSQAAATLASDEALVPEMTALLSQQTAALAVLLGVTPGTLAEALPAVGEIPVPPGEVAVGIPADLIRRRPDIRAAERTLAAATARIGEAKAELYPKLSLTGQFGFTSISFSDLFDWSSRAYAAGPAFSWNLFNAGRFQSLVDRQESITRQALLSYEQTVIGAIGEVESSLIVFICAVQQRTDWYAAVGQARQAYRLTRQQYEHGVTDLFSVLTAQQTLLTAEDSLAQSQGLAAQSLVLVYRALGGGWTAEVLPETVKNTKDAPT
jgi:multidrug efflux system outer membrane protein